MVMQEGMVSPACDIRRLLSRTVATVPIAIAGAQTRARIRQGAMATVATVRGSTSNPMVLRCAFFPRTASGLVTLPNTVSFECSK